MYVCRYFLICMKINEADALVRSLDFYPHTLHNIQYMPKVCMVLIIWVI